MSKILADLYSYTYVDKEGEIFFYMTEDENSLLFDRFIMFREFQKGEVVLWSRVVARYKPLKNLKIHIHY